MICVPSIDLNNKKHHKKWWIWQFMYIDVPIILPLNVY